MPLKPILVEAPFMQWGLNLIDSINLKSRQGHSYILTATDYFTKCQEAKALKTTNIEELILFIEENVFSRFGVSEKFITNNGSIFIGSKFTAFCGKYGVTMG